MLTHSRTPWSARHNPAGVGLELLDASGSVIGRLNDWRDADWLLSSATDRDRLEQTLARALEALSAGQPAAVHHLLESLL